MRQRQTASGALSGLNGPIAIVGTGKAARFCLRAGAAAGLPLSGIMGERIPEARQLAQRYRLDVPSSLADLARPAGLILLAVNDDAIADVARELALASGSALAGKTVAHLSGCLDESPLAPAAAAGAVTGSLHPLMTLHETCPLRGVHWFLQSGHGVFPAVARAFVEACGGHPHLLAPGNKDLYHGAATLLCQGIAASVEASRRAFAAAGLPGDVFGQACASLAEATLATRLAGPASSTLTGPATRGDRDTIARHLAALGRLDGGEDITDLYEAASRFIEALIDKGAAPRPRPQFERTSNGR